MKCAGAVKMHEKDIPTLLAYLDSCSYEYVQEKTDTTYTLTIATDGFTATNIRCMQLEIDTYSPDYVGWLGMNWEVHWDGIA